ncbi:MAG: 16S rRNA (adenine(1518)-N(6)/adenine(1519)-N(6))-dimethyltransferase RsmA [Phycisphaerae bacterium]|nr:16S rRNA (adenine(1518)-N(6)/adenine(1519)-N(6))-dimethyltransferase RsmA [Phycisphaerae bacterium]
MQTKQQIQEFLTTLGTFPKKRLGQNFLIDQNIIRLIVNSADITDQDVVLEVGCGTGTMTELIQEQAGHVISVDLDPDVFQIAREQLKDFPNVTLFNTDILTGKHHVAQEVLDAIVQARNTFKRDFLLVANLPYNVASPVMINLVTGPIPIDRMVVTIQKEVGDRMIASTGDPHYGSLSILLQATGRIELVRILKPSVFWPQPKVDSAIVKYTRDQEKTDRIGSLPLLAATLSLFLGQRRKMIKAAAKNAQDDLKAIRDWPALFEQCHMAPHLRPDQIAPDQYVALANCLTKYIPGPPD